MTLIRLLCKLIAAAFDWTYAGLSAVGGLVAIAIGIAQLGYGVTILSPFHILVGLCVALAGGQAVVAYFGAGEDDDDEEEWIDGRVPAASVAADDRREMGAIQEEGAPWSFSEPGPQRADGLRA